MISTLYTLYKKVPLLATQEKKYEKIARREAFRVLQFPLETKRGYQISQESKTSLLCGSFPNFFTLRRQTQC